MRQFLQIILLQIAISHVVLIDCAGVHVVNDMDDDIESTHKSTEKK